jgi:hypothetical protein
MIRTIVLGSVAAAAFSVGGLASAPAQAQQTPTYVCDFVNPGNVSHGFENCQSFDAVPEGRFFGPSRLIGRSNGVRVFCVDGGFAQIPNHVVAFGCNFG